MGLYDWSRIMLMVAVESVVSDADDEVHESLLGTPGRKKGGMRTLYFTNFTQYIDLVS